jgi:hypothetical protein
MSRHRPSKEVDSRNRAALGFMTLAERAPSMTSGPPEKPLGTISGQAIA